MAFLQSTDTSLHKIISVKSEITRIGRLADCDIVLEHNGISREHAIITYDAGKYYVQDLKSRNGTFVNGTSVTDKQLLNDGDIIRFCDVEFTFTTYEPGLRAYEGGSEHSSSSSKSRVSIVDSEEESGSQFTVKSEISLTDKRPVLTSANASIKLQAMIDIGRNLGADMNNVLVQLLENLLKIFPQADCAHIFLQNEQTGRLELRGHQHRDPENTDELRISRSILEKVASSKAAILSDDVSNDSRFDSSKSIVEYSIHSFMAAPIMDYDKMDVFGVIQVDARTLGRKFSHEDLDLLVSLAYQVAVCYQNARLQEVAIQERVIEREMNIANTVQRGLLPSGPPTIERYRFFEFYRPAKYLGGDYYDYIMLPDGRLVFALGDVSGKGVAASLLMAKLSAEVRSGLIIEPDFEGTMRRLNQVFCEPRWDNRFITFFFGVLNPKTNEIIFHNAGHIPPILVTPGEKEKNIEMLSMEKIGLPLGIMDDTIYPQSSFTIEDGQTLVIISDGITDAMDAKEKYFTLDGVLGFFRGANTEKVENLGKNLLGAVSGFAGRTPQTDDQSLIILGRRDNQ